MTARKGSNGLALMYRLDYLDDSIDRCILQRPGRGRCLSNGSCEASTSSVGNGKWWRMEEMSE